MKKLCITVMGLVMILAAGLPAHAVDLYKSCAYLQVELESGTGWEICYSHAHHGEISRAGNTFVTYGQSMAGAAGIVGFKKPNGKCEYYYKVQQNYCLLSAGDISVNLSYNYPRGTNYTGGVTKSVDAMNYRIEPGAYNERAGRIVFWPK